MFDAENVDPEGYDEPRVNEEREVMYHYPQGHRYKPDDMLYLRYRNERDAAQRRALREIQ